MRVIVIAPHPDDEVLGCGGTIAKHSANGDSVYVCVMTKGYKPLFADEMEFIVKDECRNADKLLGVKETFFLDFPAAMLEEVLRYKINDAIVERIQHVRPDIVYIPHRGDMQIDHKMIVDAAMVALRPKYDHVVKKIYAYETLSETGWDIPNTANEFIPTVYNDISNYMNDKTEAIKCFKTQLAEYPNARSVEAIKALAMYRGATMKMNAAEAFVLIRELQM